MREPGNRVFRLLAAVGCATARLRTVPAGAHMAFGAHASRAHPTPCPGFLSSQSVHELLRERRAVSPEMALRLARLFGNSPEFWMNAQRSVDLWIAAQSVQAEVDRIKPLNAA
mgnify:CR=1 FL=1